jgi:hypothetical protein
MTVTDSPRRVLLVANRSCPCPVLLDAVGERANAGHVHLVAPALNTRLRHALSDTDSAVAAAHDRLALARTLLEARVGRVTTEVGDADPLVALDDALARFCADEVVIGTLPPGDSNWLERGLVEKARRHVRVPVTHVVTHYGRAAA